MSYLENDLKRIEQQVRDDINLALDGVKSKLMGRRVVMKFGAYRGRIAQISEITWLHGYFGFQCRVYRIVAPFGQFIEDDDTMSFFPSGYFELTDEPAPGTERLQPARISFDA